jgi:Uma2 family endonuclease
VAEYYQMVKAGILREDDRVELIEGEIIQMPSIGSPHASCVKRANRLFNRSVGDAVVMSIQDPVQLSDYSEPVPDVVVLRPRGDFYAESHPTAADVLLLIEVSDTTLRYDQGTKVPLYAREGVPEVWVVDLNGQRLWVYREPSPTGYRITQTLRRGDHLTLLAFPDLEVAVDDILG